MIVVYILEAMELYFLLFLSAIFWMMIEACASFLMGGTVMRKLSLALVGKTVLSKSLIQLSAEGSGYTPTLLVV